MPATTTPHKLTKLCFATRLFNLSLLNIRQIQHFQYLCAGNVSINPLKQYANELNKQETDIWEAFANFANGFPQNELNNK